MLHTVSGNGYHSMPLTVNGSAVKSCLTLYVFIRVITHRVFLALNVRGVERYSVAAQSHAQLVIYMLKYLYKTFIKRPMILQLLAGL